MTVVVTDALLLAVLGSIWLALTVAVSWILPAVVAVTVMDGCQVACGARLASVQVTVPPLFAQLPPAAALDT